MEQFFPGFIGSIVTNDWCIIGSGPTAIYFDHVAAKKLQQGLIMQLQKCREFIFWL